MMKCKMTKEQKCEIAKAMIGSTARDEVILLNVANTNYLIKEEVSGLADNY